MALWGFASMACDLTDEQLLERASVHPWLLPPPPLSPEQQQAHHQRLQRERQQQQQQRRRRQHSQQQQQQQQPWPPPAPDDPSWAAGGAPARGGGARRAAGGDGDGDGEEEVASGRAVAEAEAALRRVKNLPPGELPLGVGMDGLGHLTLEGRPSRFPGTLLDAMDALFMHAAGTVCVRDYKPQVRAFAFLSRCLAPCAWGAPRPGVVFSVCRRRRPCQIRSSIVAAGAAEGRHGDASRVLCRSRGDGRAALD